MRTKGEILKSPPPPGDEGSTSAILALGNPLAIYVYGGGIIIIFFLKVIHIHIYVLYGDYAFFHQKNFVLFYITAAACAYA